MHGAFRTVLPLLVLAVAVFLLLRSGGDEDSQRSGIDGRDADAEAPRLVGSGDAATSVAIPSASAPLVPSTTEARSLLRVIVRWPGDEAEGRSAQVAALLADDSMRGATTDAEGVVVFENVPSGVVSLWAAARPALFGLDAWEIDAGEDEEVELHLDGGVVIEGRVLDAGSGAPVAGAVVGVPWRHEGWSRGRLGPGATITDAAGRFEVWWVLESTQAYGDYVIAALARSYALEVVPFPDMEEGRRRAALDLHLQPGGTARGLVARPSGTPAPGALVTLLPQDETWTPEDAWPDAWSTFSRDRMFVALTGADGRYEVLGLPLDIAFAAFADAEGFARSAAVLDLDPSVHRRDVVADLRLREAARIRIQVVDADGDPLMDAKVNVDTPAWRSWRETDEDGLVEEDTVEPGKRRVRVTSPGLPPVVRRIEAPAGAWTRVEIRMERGAGIAGVLVDAAGAPVPGATVGAWVIDGGRRGSARTNDEGRFRIEALTRGRYRLKARTRGGESLPCVETIVEAPIDGAQLVIRELGSIRVLPTVGDGIPLPLWMEVRYRQGTATVQRHVRCSQTRDGSRAYRCRLPAGRGTFRFALDGLAPVETEIDVPTGDEVHDVEVSFDSGRVLSGRVVDAAGRPIAGALVQVIDRYGLDRQTDADGRFTIPLLAIEPITIRFDVEGRFPLDRAHHVGRDPEPLEIVLHRGSVLRGRVVDADGHGVADQEVMLQDAAIPGDSSRRAFATTDAIGAFRLRVLAGRYAVGLHDGDGFRPQTEITLEEEGDVELELRAPPR